jgi:hypothetical protein
MLRLLPFALLAFLQCTATTPGPERPPSSDEASPPAGDAAGGNEFLVGVLGETGSVDCPDGMTQRWSNVRPVIGWTPVTMVQPPPIELFDRPVLARGEPTSDEHRALEIADAKECPIAQMRSDMVETPRGMRLRREPATSMPHFRVDELRPLAELEVEEIDGKLAVEFRNPLPVELRGVTLVMHYEGCHGKPGTAQETSAFGALAVGAGMRASFPLLVDAERGPGRLEPHRASSLQILANGERAHFDLDVRLSSAGATTRCPGDEASK